MMGAAADSAMDVVAECLKNPLKSVLGRFIDERPSLVYRCCHRREWNPNEGLLADQVLQADGQGDYHGTPIGSEPVSRTASILRVRRCLGQAFWLGGGDYARASFHLRKSLEIYATTYERTPDSNFGDWSLGKAGGLCGLLRVTWGIVEEELNLTIPTMARRWAIRRDRETSYNPLLAERGLPLMKLGRFSVLAIGGSMSCF